MTPLGVAVRRLPHALAGALPDYATEHSAGIDLPAAIEADVVLDNEHLVDARFIAPRMQYVKKWAPEQWPLAFQGLLHLIPKQDFGLIEDEMQRGKIMPDVSLGSEDGACILDEMAARA